MYTYMYHYIYIYIYIYIYKTMFVTTGIIRTCERRKENDVSNASAYPCVRSGGETIIDSLKIVLVVATRYAYFALYITAVVGIWRQDHKRVCIPRPFGLHVHARRAPKVLTDIHFVFTQACCRTHVYVCSYRDSERPNIYRLYSAVIHSGTNAHCGHYYSYVRAFNTPLQCDTRKCNIYTRTTAHAITD